MKPSKLLDLVSVACLTGALLGQSPHDIVFCGSSTSGGADQHAFVDAASGAVLQEQGAAATDNVTGAGWTERGAALYVAQSLTKRISRASWSNGAATWATFYSAADACYGVEIDHGRRALWTLSGAPKQLLCLDVDPLSVSYGQLVASSAPLAGLREAWALSASGDAACVPQLQLGAIDLVDLAPGSATFGQVVDSAVVPGLATLSFAFSVDCKFAKGDRYVFLTWVSTGTTAGLAVYDRATSTWLDFSAAPGLQHLALGLGSPNAIDVAQDGAFAVISGQGSGGWAGRAVIDYANPLASTFTVYQGLAIPRANAISLSPDEGRVALTSSANQLSAPSDLWILDPTTGAVLRAAQLPTMWNVYTTAWSGEDAKARFSSFGSACAGTAGAPTLGPLAGSRSALGSLYQLQLTGLPVNGALVAFGLSDSVTSAGLPLPLALDALGMSGCTQYVDALALDFVIGAGQQAIWQWPVPSLGALIGVEFFNQAFAYDPAANAFGWTASNAGRSTIGL